VAATSIAEIERAVMATQRSDPAQGEVLRRWFEDRVLLAFDDRVLAFDLPAARILATYRVPERAPLDDALIAAVAESTDMVVVTRNIRHFKMFGVRCVNPWEL
jgi:predicted nucleic acid-binding protein